MGQAQKQTSLKDLSKQLFTKEDLPAFNEELHKGSDRASALIGGAVVEYTLRGALTTRMYLPTDKHYKEMFLDQNAPISSFYHKILFGRVLGIYEEEIFGALMIIKNVRNAFAHTVHHINFNDSAVAREIDKFPTEFSDRFVLWHLKKQLSEEKLSNREKYIQFCLALAQSFEMDGVENDQSSMIFSMTDVRPRT